MMRCKFGAVDNIILFILILFCFQQETTYVVTATPDDVSSDLESIRVEQKMPGLAALALKNGKVVGQGAAGLRRYNHSSPFLISDSVNIGSCTKWMTATLAGRLVDRRILSWNTRVYECFPNYTTFHSALRNVTLEQLLAHRAGIQNSVTFYNQHGIDIYTHTGNISQIRRWAAETVLKDGPQVPPGEYLYSNPGYTVAAVMMEQKTGQDWESLIREHIFNPLNMTSASIGPVYDDNLPPKAPVGHDLPINSTVPIPRAMLSPRILHAEYALSGPSGFIALTLEDFAKFLYAHVIGDTSGYLSKDTAARLKRPYNGTEGYGLGVMAFNRTWALPGQALFHDGDAFGFNTVFWMAPAKDIITISITNCRSEDINGGLALDAAIGVLLRKYLNSAKNYYHETYLN